MSVQRSLIFLHIPKTGGMTLSAIVARQFPHAAVYQINGPLGTSREALYSLSEEQRRQIQCLSGHVPFGLHVCLPHPAIYVTLLRNPVERILSIYYYARRRPEWGLHKQILDNQWSLYDFVVSEVAMEFHNQQTRMLSGADEPDNTPDALEKAKKNLAEHFALAGLTERFDESVLLCRKLFGWRNVFYYKKNVNRHRPQRGEIPRTTIAMIEEKNALDLALYGIVRQRFDELIHAYPLSNTALRQFQRWNRLYRLAERCAHLSGHLMRAAKTC